MKTRQTGPAPTSFQKVRFLSLLLLLTLTFASIPRHAGAIAGGDRGAQIGYAVALSAEANNRQLHQKEIEWLEKHTGKFAAALYGTAPTREQRADAQARLAQQALRDIDKGWSLKLGSQTDKEAEAFLRTNNEHLFEVKSLHEYLDGSTDGEREISSYSQKEFDALSTFYRQNVHRATTANPQGSLRNANKAFAKEQGVIDAIKEGRVDYNQVVRDLPVNAVNALLETPETLEGAGNYLDAVLPTKNRERLDILYGSHADGSVLQANLATGDALATLGMLTGTGGFVNAGAKGALRRLDATLEIKPGGVAGKGEAGEALSRSENIPHVGDIPDGQLKTNIDETMGYIFDDSKRPPKKIRDKWGEDFKNEDADLPTQDANGNFIEYKEYKVRPLKGGENVHRIVVGSDGNYYYTNTHYGSPKYQGRPFYKAGKLSKEKIDKIFKDSK